MAGDGETIPLTVAKHETVCNYQLGKQMFHKHKVGNVGIISNFVFPYLQFSSLFTLTNVSKCEVRTQRAYASLDYM